MIEMRKKNFDAAGKEFRAAIAADPTLAAGWVNVGILQELYDGSFGDAIASYRRYVALRPADEQVVTGWIREIEDAQSGVAASMPNPPPKGGKPA
jgi:predicted TPR repeat methyltransferase